MKDETIRWLASLSDKAFAELFYQAVRDRNTSDIPEEPGHFVLGDAFWDADSQSWDVDFVALPSTSDRWSDDSPIGQEGECPGCKNTVRSWAKRQTCPVCGTETYGT